MMMRPRGAWYSAFTSEKARHKTCSGQGGPIRLLPVFPNPPRFGRGLILDCLILDSLDSGFCSPLGSPQDGRLKPCRCGGARRCAADREQRRAIVTQLGGLPWRMEVHAHRYMQPG